MTVETSGETVDTLLNGRVRIVQPADGYRVAIDSVLLAAAITASPGETILDAGAGTGAVSFCLLARMPGLHLTALEAEPHHADLLREGIALNGLGNDIEPLEGDIAEPPTVLKTRQFDHVITNPPFHPAGAHRRPPVPSRDAAGHESLPLPLWIDACGRRLRSGGRLTLVHRADRLHDILASLGDRFGCVTVVPLWPHAASDTASRVIVVARKNSRSPARIMRGLVLHGDDGRYTADVERLLRDAAALSAVTAI